MTTSEQHEANPEVERGARATARVLLRFHQSPVPIQLRPQPTLCIQTATPRTTSHTKTVTDEPSPESIRQVL